MKPIYLDYAAATPVDDEVLRAMLPYFSETFYNPSSLYVGAREAKSALETARSNVAQTIGCRPSEIVFTSGGTESANLAIRGVAEKHPESNIIVSAIEHEAVREPAHLYGTHECPVDERGIVKLESLTQLVNDSTVLVSVMYANNEVGSVQPIKQVVELIEQVRKDRARQGNSLPIYVHADACQAPLYLDCNVARLGVDLLTLNGGKIHGPKQSGILYVKAGVDLQPQILGGGQEHGMRSGTEHVANAVGFAQALQNAQLNHKEFSKTCHGLADEFIKSLKAEFDVTLNGHTKKRLPNNIHVTFHGTDNERVLFSLDEQGVWAAAGSACSASNEEVSHVLTAMGLSERDAQASVRFTIGRDTTSDELKQTIKALRRAVEA